MGSPSSKRRFAQLWQLPLLVVALGLFGYAAYLFIDPKPGLTLAQKVEIARTYLSNDRPEAAIDQLNPLLETKNLPRQYEADIRLALGQAIDEAQKQKKLRVAANFQKVIEQTERALGLGAKEDWSVYRRLGENYEALEQPDQALKNYRRAEAADPNHALSLKRKVIDLQLDRNLAEAAEQSLDDYLKDGRLSESERAWALAQKGHLLADAGQFAVARALLAQALKLDSDPTSQGQVNYQLGYCDWKLGDNAQAERLLRLARDQLRVQHPLDADAAYLLGKIRQAANDPGQGIAFYDAVLLSHPDAALAPMARLGRGICRLMLNLEEPGLTDLHDVVNAISEKPARQKFKPDAVATLRQAVTLLVADKRYQGALEVLAYEQLLGDKPGPEFFSRLAQVYQKRADQVEQSINQAAAAEEQYRRTQQVRDLRVKAGDAFLAYAKALTAVDDKGYGDAIWKAADLYDRAGSIQLAIAALELFVAERPADGLAPDALLRLGRAYQATGQLDNAISAFQRNQFRYPQTLAASKSGVPLAQSLIAKGPENYAKAQKVLTAVIEDNPLITPEAEEFREALFELAQLFYRTDRYEEAVARLEEITQRYNDDPRLGQLLFLMADSYRKSAALLSTIPTTRPTDATVASASAATAIPTLADPREAQAARRERLTKAQGLYDRVIEKYRGTLPQAEMDQLYLKLAHFYRADCMYELGDYASAIRAYDAAALRYQEDPSALAAYVQIVNSYCALGRFEEAKHVNERAKVLLRAMPKDIFEKAKFSLSKDYWEQWLKWTNDAGMF